MNVLARLTRQAIGGLLFVVVLMVFLNEPAPSAVFIDAATQGVPNPGTR